MNFGINIANLRKKNNFSQEELAEMVGVTRQTISKWELGETTPDINQAKVLSKIFNISLDKLVNNDIQNMLIERVSNTERLAGITIKILRRIGIFFFIFLVIIVVLFIMFIVGRASSDDYDVVGRVSITCNLDSESYLYEVEYNKNYQIINSGGDACIANHIDIEKLDDANKVMAHIDDYFKDRGGSCNTYSRK